MKYEKLYFKLMSYSCIDSDTRSLIWGKNPFSVDIEKIYQDNGVPVYKVITYPEEKSNIVSFDFINEKVISNVVDELNQMSREHYLSLGFQVPQHYVVPPIILKDVQYDGEKLCIYVYVICDEITWNYFHKKGEKKQ